MEGANPVKKFRIRQLPEVVTRELVVLMPPSDIFSMSLCSEKMKNQLQRNMFKADNVWITIALNDSGPRITFSIRKDGKEHNVLHLKHRTSMQEKYLAPFGSYTEGEFLDDAIIFRVPLVLNRDPGQLKKVHEYVCNLFNCNSAHIYARYDSLVLYRTPDDNTVKRCIVTQNAHRQIGEIGPFLQRQPKQDILIVEWLYYTDILEFFTSILEAPNLIFRELSLFWLWSFKGTHLLCEKAVLPFQTIKDMILSWSRNYMENLKSIIIYLDPADVACSRSLQELITKEADTELAARVEKWDSSKREKIYPYESIIAKYHTFPQDTFDCSSGYDIVRNTDGRRATIKFSPEHFMFFVWP